MYRTSFTTLALALLVAVPAAASNAAPQTSFRPLEKGYGITVGNALHVDITVEDTPSSPELVVEVTEDRPSGAVDTVLLLNVRTGPSTGLVAGSTGRSNSKLALGGAPSTLPADTDSIAWRIGAGGVGTCMFGGEDVGDALTSSPGGGPARGVVAMGFVDGDRRGVRVVGCEDGWAFEATTSTGASGVAFQFWDGTVFTGAPEIGAGPAPQGVDLCAWVPITFPGAMEVCNDTDLVFGDHLASPPSTATLVDAAVARVDGSDLDRLSLDVTRRVNVFDADIDVVEVLAPLGRLDLDASVQWDSVEGAPLVGRLIFQEIDVDVSKYTVRKPEVVITG